MVKIGIMTVPQGFLFISKVVFLGKSSSEVAPRAPSKHYSFDIFNTLLILLFNTLFTDSKLQEEHNMLPSALPVQSFWVVEGKASMSLIDDMIEWVIKWNKWHLVQQGWGVGWGGEVGRWVGIVEMWLFLIKKLIFT